jgi:hypothetical protein
MKKVILFVFSVLLLTSCATTYINRADGKVISKDVADRILQREVQDRLQAHDYRIFVDMMFPQRAPSRHLYDPDWCIEIHGDSLGSYLPFMGRAYSIPYGGGYGLHFIKPIESYLEEQVKPDQKRVTMQVRTEEDTYQYVVDIWSNGKADIDIYSRNRDNIRFSGQMELNNVLAK